MELSCVLNCVSGGLTGCLHAFLIMAHGSKCRQVLKAVKQSHSADKHTLLLSLALASNPLMCCIVCQVQQTKVHL